MVESQDNPAPHVDVSVLMPTYNARRHIEEAVGAMRAQRFEGTLEFLVIDGGSIDGTREVVQALAREDPRIRLIDNPARRTPHALNRGLREARGRFVARMDAHTMYPPAYLAAGVERLRRGDVDWVSGAALPEGRGVWSRRVALALQSRMGVGAAAFRLAQREEREVDSGFAGVWHRSFFEIHGGWDEGWPVNQDGELAGRVRGAGAKILCLPEMAARYIPRDTLPQLARQYGRYGVYKAKTCRRHPAALRRSLLLPPALVATAASAAVPGRSGHLARRAIAVYVTALAAEAVRMRRRASARDAAALPLVWATMHLSWGAGFIIGSARFGPPLRAVAQAFGARPSPADSAAVA